jgi:hypothetical protein
MAKGRPPETASEQVQLLMVKCITFIRYSIMQLRYNYILGNADKTSIAPAERAEVTSIGNSIGGNTAVNGDSFFLI